MDNMTISERIQFYMKERRIRQIELANALHTSSSTIYNWINTNMNSIPSQYLLPIADTLGVSLYTLLTGESEESSDTDVSTDTNLEKLISIFNELDSDGKTIVLATAIQEQRRKQAL